MYINIPEDVSFLCTKLENGGFPAYVVGGCVRDILLKKEPKDWDITTSARYDEIVDCLKDFVKVIPMKNSREHNVCIVRYNHQQYEIATFRADGEYVDHRHTKTKVVAEIEDDLARRDFTINAMAYRPLTGQLLDIDDGYEDLKNKIIRAVGDPDTRLNEDALRILRAYRFAVQLGFSIDKELEHILVKHWDDLKYVSMERKREEINKMLLSYQRSPYAFKLLEVINEVTDEPVIFTVANRNTEKRFNIRFFYQDFIANCPNDLEIRWAAILNNRDDSEEILRKFKFDNTFVKNVKALVERREYHYGSKVEVKRLCAKLGPALIEKLFDIIDAETYTREHGYLGEIEQAREWLKEIQAEPYLLKDLAVNGDDLSKYYSGRELGKKLNYLLELVQEHPELNKKDILLNIVRLA